MNSKLIDFAGFVVDKVALIKICVVFKDGGQLVDRRHLLHCSERRVVSQKMGDAVEVVNRRR